ncbi:hypothetical protein LR003_03885 [candidate division NPL-UPA2 bacterium]|nr:hypothetical protein [candidate division NPL-UPA2 bacterium]
MLTIILGLLITLIGILWLVPPIPGSWFLGHAWPEARSLIIGFLSLGLVGGGLIAVVAGISSLKDKAAAKKEEAKRKKEKKGREPVKRD